MKFHEYAIEVFRQCGIPDAEHEIFLIFADILKISPGEAHSRIISGNIDDEHIRRAESIIKIRCETRRPLAYIMKKQEFFGIDFFIDENVLVPRPETEILVESVLSRLSDEKLLGIDVGTGSGAIAIALLKNRPEWRIVGTDIFNNPLKIAVKNALLNNVADRFFPLQCDILDGIKSADFIVSNPPYIPSAEISKLSPEVQSEPKIALDGGRNGLKFIKTLLQSAQKMLSPKFIAFEFGFGQMEKIEKILRNYDNYYAEFINDNAGLPRVATMKRFS